MILQTNSKKMLLAKGKMLRASNAWAFDTTGTQWVALLNTGFSIRFSSSSYIYIDFADGTGLHRYNTINGFISFDGGTGLSNQQPIYIYKDGKPGNYKRTVRYIVPEKSKVIAITVTSQLASIQGQILRIGFSELFNLQTLQISRSLIGALDESYLQNKSITQINFDLAFATGTKYDGRIPAEMLKSDKSYTLFSYSNTLLGGKSFKDSNLDKIVNLKNTLTTLTLVSVGLSDMNGPDGGLPDNFAELSNLTALTITRNNYSSPPLQINLIPNLTSLFFGNAGMTTWGDLSGCVNLTSYTMDGCVNAPAYIPHYLPKLTKLRNVRLTGFSKLQGAGGYDDPARLDALIKSFYDHWDTYAPKIGANNIQYRGLKIEFAATENLTGSSAPSGTFQQPVGYVQGSNNGSPASPREMLWVFVNQYGCQVIYNNN